MDHLQDTILRRLFSPECFYYKKLVREMLQHIPLCFIKAQNMWEDRNPGVESKIENFYYLFNMILKYLTTTGLICRRGKNLLVMINWSLCFKGTEISHWLIHQRVRIQWPNTVFYWNWADCLNMVGASKTKKVLEHHMIITLYYYYWKPLNW